MTDHITTTDGIRIAYYVDDFSDPWRPAQTVLMLHSTMGSSRRYYSMVPGLARDYRVVRMDLRGHGASDLPADDVPFSLARMACDAVELLDHLGIARAHVLGNSAGGGIAQRLAIDFPERVSSIVLYSSAPGMKRKQQQTAGWLPQVAAKGLRAFLAETIADRFPVADVDPRLVEWFLDGAGKTDVSFLSKWVLHMNGLDLMDEIRRIRCPALIIGPGAEPIGHASVHAEMQQAIPNAELIYYEDARHNICDYLPDRCVSDTLDFLRRHFGQQERRTGDA